MGGFSVSRQVPAILIAAFLISFPETAFGGWPGTFAMCRKVNNVAADALRSDLPSGGAIPLQGPEKIVSFGTNGVTVVDEAMGIRVLSKIERRDDGTVALHYRLPTDAKARTPAVHLILPPATREVAKLETQEGRALIDKRTVSFLRKNLETHGKEPTIEMVPEQIGLTYLIAEYFRLKDGERGSNADRVFIQRYDQLWRDFVKANPQVSGIPLKEQLALWADRNRFLIKTDEPIAFQSPEVNPQPELLTQFFKFIHEKTGENIIRTGASHFAAFVPHVNIGIEIPMSTGQLTVFKAREKPANIPHDIFVNMLNYSWTKAPELLDSGKPAELALGRYNPAERKTPGTYSHQIGELKETDKFAPVAGVVAANSDKIRNFIASHVEQGEGVFVVPMPSSRLGVASHALIDFARAVAAVPAEGRAPLSAIEIAAGGDPQKAQKYLWERLHNAGRNFSGGTANTEVVGKTVVLVDDVRTTDASLTEARHLLYEKGAKKVIVITLAEAGGGHDSIVPDGDGKPRGAKPAAPATKPAAPFTTRRPSDIATFLNKEVAERDADPIATHAWKAATALASTNSPIITYDFMRLVEREADVARILESAGRYSSKPRDLNRLAMKYDVNFIVEQFNELSAAKIGALLGNVEREPSTYDRFLLRTMNEFVASGEAMGAYPNNLSPQGRILAAGLKRLQSEAQQQQQ